MNSLHLHSFGYKPTYINQAMTRISSIASTSYCTKMRPAIDRASIAHEAPESHGNMNDNRSTD